MFTVCDFFHRQSTKRNILGWHMLGVMFCALLKVFNKF